MIAPFVVAFLVSFLPFDDEGAGRLATLVEVGAPVGPVDCAGTTARRHESVRLDAVVHGVAGADALLVVARV